MNAELALIQFLVDLPMTGLLLIGIVVLWRDNQALRKELREARSVSAGNTALLLDQNTTLDKIEHHVSGNTPSVGTKPVKFSDS